MIPSFPHGLRNELPPDGGAMLKNWLEPVFFSPRMRLRS